MSVFITFKMLHFTNAASTMRYLDYLHMELHSKPLLVAQKSVLVEKRSIFGKI